jgi:hypothetical protein
MSQLERLCNYTLYSPLPNRISQTYSWLAVLIGLEIITAIVALVPLYLYFRLDRASRAKIWLRFLPFFSLLFIGAVSGVIGWTSYMKYLTALQVTTSEGSPPELYPPPPDPDAQPMSVWYPRGFLNLVTYFVFFPVEFSCFTASKMFVLERLLTFGTSSMGASSSNRAHRIFKWLLISLAAMFVVLTVASWTGAGMAAPFSQKGLGLNLWDVSDRNKAAIETGLDKLFVAVAILYITMSLALVTAAFGCILFCFYCFRRIQQVSLALLQAQSMSSSKTQAVEATLRKTRVLIMGTSAVVTFSFIVRAAFQVLYGASFTATYNIQNCASQCNVGCQGELFVLQVHAWFLNYANIITAFRFFIAHALTHASPGPCSHTPLQAVLRYSPVYVTITFGVFQCLPCILAAWAMLFNQRALLMSRGVNVGQKQGLMQALRGNGNDSLL